MKESTRRIVGFVALVVGLGAAFIAKGYNTTDYTPWHSVASYPFLIGFTYLWLGVAILSLFVMIVGFKTRVISALSIALFIVFYLLVKLSQLPILPSPPLDYLDLFIVIGWPVVNAIDIVFVDRRKKKSELSAV